MLGQQAYPTHEMIGCNEIVQLLLASCYRGV